MKNMTDETIETLTRLLYAGTWYLSALEIDQYEQPYNGLQLEEMLTQLLSKFESGEYLVMNNKEE